MDLRIWIDLNIKHQWKYEILVKAWSFLKRKCLSEDPFITPVDIIGKPLVATCKVFKNFYYENI